MTKREEIMDGITKVIALAIYNSPIEHVHLYDVDGVAQCRRFAKDIASYLHSQGVVIKVGENQVLPNRVYFSEDNKDMELELSGRTQMDMIKAKFMQTESLIKEIK